MDFSKQLANLQNSASRASRQNNGEGGDRSHRDNNDHYRRNDSRDRFDYRRGRGRGRGRGRDRGRYSYRNDPYRSNNGNRNRRHMSEAEEDFFLPKLVQAIPKYHPVPVQKKRKQRHVCLLLLTIDDLHHEQIWRSFLSSQRDTGTDENLMISVICHAKFPDKVTSPWLKQRLLVHKPSVRDLKQYKERYGKNTHIRDTCLPPVRYFSRKPEWGSVEITRAMIDLLDEGLRIGTNRDSTASVAKGLNDREQAEEYKKRYSCQRYIATNVNESVEDSSHKGIGLGNNPNKISSAIPTVDRFIFVSESCIPVTTMEEFESALFRDDDESDQTPSKAAHDANPNPYDGTNANKSWVKARNTPNNGYARQLQWDATDPSIPKSKIWKADQWIALTRHHAWPIISLIDDAVQTVQKHYATHNDQGGGGGHYGNNRNKLQLALWHCFRQVKASDEMYFPTVMALLGILADDNNEMEQDVGDTKAAASSESASASEMNDEVSRKRVTYCDWSMNAKNPASFVINSDDEYKELRRVMKLAREEGCLFARKFTKKGEHPGQPSFDSGALEGENDAAKDVAITGEKWLEILSKLSGTK